MNGAPLTPDRGAPLRVVVPGHSGVRWVKWVDALRVARAEAAGFYQQRDYKVLPAAVASRAQADAEGWWARAPALQSNGVNSVVARAVLRAGGEGKGGGSGGVVLDVRGYALGGAAGGQVRRVEVSADRGRSWAEAEITYQEGRWSWTLWAAAVEVPQGAAEGERVVWSRATDESGGTQAPSVEWNLRGVGYNAYGEARY
jgi:sulfite oxidase